MNFVKCHRYPVVFRHLDAQGMMPFAGTKLEAFNPVKLARDEEGFLFHEVTVNEKLKTYGGFDTDLAMQLAEQISVDADDKFLIEWKGRIFPIDKLI